MCASMRPLRHHRRLDHTCDSCGAAVAAVSRTEWTKPGTTKAHPLPYCHRCDPGRLAEEIYGSSWQEEL
jgi:hypothetical protein